MLHVPSACERHYNHFLLVSGELDFHNRSISSERFTCKYTPATTTHWSRTTNYLNTQISVERMRSSSDEWQLRVATAISENKLKSFEAKEINKSSDYIARWSLASLSSMMQCSASERSTKQWTSRSFLTAQHKITGIEEFKFKYHSMTIDRSDRGKMIDALELGDYLHDNFSTFRSR